MHEAVQRSLEADNLPTSGRGFDSIELTGRAKFGNALPLKCLLGGRQPEFRLQTRLSFSHRLDLQARLIYNGGAAFCHAFAASDLVVHGDGAARSWSRPDRQIND
jgi:hypothetical protein